MNQEEKDNKLRCFAAEIIAQLWQSGNVSQLELLQMQVNSSIEDIKGKQSVAKNN
jgi:hypothetical protein